MVESATLPNRYTHPQAHIDALLRRLSEQEQATRELRRWSIYVHEDDPRFISIRRDDQPGDTLLRASEGHVDQAQAAEFAAAVRAALSSEGARGA